MRLMDLETSGFQMKFSVFPDNRDDATNLRIGPTEAWYLEQDFQGCWTVATLMGLKCPAERSYTLSVLNKVIVRMRKLVEELLHVKSCYHQLILSWIGENMPEYQNQWDVLLTKTLKSVQLSLDNLSFFEYGNPVDFRLHNSFDESVLSQKAATARGLSEALHTIYSFVDCYEMSSCFRACFYNTSFYATGVKIWIWEIRNTLIENELDNSRPYPLLSEDVKLPCFEQYLNFRSKLEKEFHNLREIAFLYSVIISPQYGKLFKKRDRYEIPSDLLADIDVVLSKAWEAIVNRSISSSHYSEGINTAIRFICIAIYTEVRIIEEAAAPLQHWFLNYLLQCQKGGPSLSWIDEIGVEYWDIILEGILEILKDGSCLLVHWKDKNEVLHKQLRFLKYCLTGPPEGFTRKGNWNEISNTIKVIISRQATSLFLSCYYGKSYGKFCKQAKKVMEKTIRLIYSFPRETLSHRPRADGDLESLHNNLESLHNLSGKIEILKHSMISSLQTEEEQYLGKAQEELTFLIDTLEKISNERTEYEELNSLSRQLGDLAYAIYFIAHPLLDGSCPNLYLKLWFSDFEKDTKLIKEKVESISENNRSSNQDLDITRSSNNKLSHGNDPRIDEEIVGFVDEEIKVVENIVRGSEDMEMVLIAGMPGLGKTTLAKKVYNNQEVAEHFDVRSWCCISQGYQRKDLIVQILKHIKPNEEGMDEDRLADILRKELMQRRYLIVMDDIWDITPWNDLSMCLPNGRNGSRILLTSRFNDIPFQPKTKIHFLNPLSDDESWELLQKKLHLRENCPSELLEIGVRIAKGCKGVPLVVVLVAGLLADTNLDQWQTVACNVMSYVVNDSQRHCADILEMSYKNLPYYLKPCLLYLGCFPPDYEISSKKLIQLWIAEGFIRRSVTTNVECIAEGYLMDLIQRNLIQVAERRCLGDIKTCRAHDLVHDFCSSKGKEKKFVQQITRDSGAAHKQTFRRSILYDWGHDSVDWSSYKDVCSLLIYSSVQTDSTSYIFENFKLLRVLDLMTPFLIWDIIDLPDAIGLLVHLRFLAGPFSSIPSSIGNLTNLVTFHMVALGTEVLNLPITFYSLVKLRHLHINSATIFKGQLTDPGSPFYSLQTLSTLLLPAYGDSVLTLFPNLRKLKCLFVNRQQRITHPKFNLLTQLESLEMTYLLGDWDETVPLRHINWEFSFPPSIRKLTLKMFCLPWSEMSIIEKLPNLEVLKLDRSAFVGKEWNMGDCTFHKLKYLRLRGLNIIRWNASQDRFPHLENLVVQGCEYLEEIPTDFANISTLRTIEVSGCKFSVEASAREIYEEQVEYGNEELKILARDNDPNKAYIWSGTVRRRLASEFL